MKIAVEGCMDGELDNVYATLLHLQEVEKTKIDLLICCGDFKATRNEKDLQSVNGKLKCRSKMSSFWKYYSGEKKAPFPTIFIGGNREATNYLWELYYGGWAAPDIYFLGFAGVVKFGSIRIGGLSGIYKAQHYHLGHFEGLPYDHHDRWSLCHVREYDVYKLMQVEEPIDIFLSHEWPLGITDCGDWMGLVRENPYFKKEIEKKTLGSKPAAKLLEKLKPAYWFSAHPKCKFAALVQHGEGAQITKFLGLDKCGKQSNFLQIIETETELGPFEIQYDEEWLAITRRFDYVFPRTIKPANFGGVRLNMQESRQWVRNRLQDRGVKPFEFVQTVPCYDPSKPISGGPSPGHCRNPQIEALMQFLELPYLLDNASESKELTHSLASFNSAGSPPAIAIKPTGCSLQCTSEGFVSSTSGVVTSKLPLSTSSGEEWLDGILHKLVKPSPKFDYVNNPTLHHFNEATRHIQKGLVLTLNSMGLSDYEGMVLRANGVFAIMNNLSTNYLSFYEQVKEFIKCSALLARTGIGGPSCEELQSQYEEKKVCFHEVIRLHTETLTSLSKSQEHSSHLEEEIACTKDRLNLLEAQLSSCKTEASSFTTRFNKISQDLLSLEVDLAATSEALELSKNFSTGQEAAKQAFDVAKATLNEL